MTIHRWVSAWGGHKKRAIGKYILERYDTIIIGAGHNGLVCAAYLAQRGHKLLVLEASQEIGGMAASREFHPGFRASVAHAISHVPRKIADDLNLHAHGFTSSSKVMQTIGLRLVSC